MQEQLTCCPSGSSLNLYWMEMWLNSETKQRIEEKSYAYLEARVAKVKLWLSDQSLLPGTKELSETVLCAELLWNNLNVIIKSLENIPPAPLSEYIFIIF